MIRFFSIILAGLLVLPVLTTPAIAKVPSAAPQVHVVKQGDTLYEIAQRHGLTVNELKRLNGLGSSRLKIGQKLALTRSAAPPTTQPAAKKTRQEAGATVTTSDAIHVVKKGDTLFNIARSHRMTVEQLKQFNNLEGNRLRIGQRLALSGATGVQAAAAPRASSRSVAEVHVVRKGETLSTIARRHHLSVKELKRLNGLRGSNLKIGQRLALNDPYEERNPILLPGDSSEDEVLDMAYSAGTALEQIAFNYLSTPYRFGGNSRKGIDCSAFVQQVFREAEVDLPRSAREQFRVGEKVERDNLQPGDLLFFKTYAKFPSHVGIYLGDGKMIHASSRSRRVVVTSIDFPYYRKRFIGAKRISLIDDEDATQTAETGEETADADAVDAGPPVETAMVPDGTVAAPLAEATPVNMSATTTVAAGPEPQMPAPAALPAVTPPAN